MRCMESLKPDRLRFVLVAIADDFDFFAAHPWLR